MRKLLSENNIYATYRGLPRCLQLAKSNIFSVKDLCQYSMLLISFLVHKKWIFHDDRKFSSPLESGVLSSGLKHSRCPMLNQWGTRTSDCPIIKLQASCLMRNTSPRRSLHAQVGTCSYWTMIGRAAAHVPMQASAPVLPVGKFNGTCVYK